jgi:hypothetical protein
MLIDDTLIDDVTRINLQENTDFEMKPVLADKFHFLSDSDSLEDLVDKK